MRPDEDDERGARDFLVTLLIAVAIGAIGALLLAWASGHLRLS